MKNNWIFYIIFLLSTQIYGQDGDIRADSSLGVSLSPSKAVRDSAPLPSSTFKEGKRQLLIGTTTTALYAGLFIGLNEAWYKDYPRSPFHTYNDAGEWQQMDKVGHAWAVYTKANLSYGLYRWAGMNNKKAVWLSSASALAFMSSIEYLDGRSKEWGWSWADAGANAVGALLFATQQLHLKEQRLQLKFSSSPKVYPSDQAPRARELFGQTLPNRTLKDYNAQTYWLSFSLPPSFKLPGWLQLSLGYGAEGMLGGYQNVAYDKNGAITFNRPDIRRYRQWYLAPDIDLTRIRTGKKWVKTALFALNSLKFPAPSLEFSRGRLKANWLTF